MLTGPLALSMVRESATSYQPPATNHQPRIQNCSHFSNHPSLSRSSPPTASYANTTHTTVFVFLLGSPLSWFPRGETNSNSPRVHKASAIVFPSDVLDLVRPASMKKRLMGISSLEIGGGINGKLRREPGEMTAESETTAGDEDTGLQGVRLLQGMRTRDCRG